MLSQLLKVRLSLNWCIVILLVWMGVGLLAVSLKSLLGGPMLTIVQLGPWYGFFLPFHW
jgi:hypothetical protein